MHIVSIKFFLLDIWRYGQDIKSQVQIHCKDVVPMMGLDHHSCPLVSLMILRCVPIWKQRESGRGYSSPEESNQAGQYSRGRQNDGYSRERNQKAIGGRRNRSWANRVFTVLNQLRVPPA